MTSETQGNFIFESITPAIDRVDTKAMASGGPGLPPEFTWRGQRLRISTVLRAWRETGPCSHGSSESYVRKHWFEVETVWHGKAQIYFERQARSHSKKKRWWLYTIENKRAPTNASAATAQSASCADHPDLSGSGLC
jgi:hypothetical protein